MTIQQLSNNTYTCKVLTAGTPSRIEGRTYTAELIEAATKSLSYRPLNIDHSEPLPFPENMTLEANWNPILNALFAEIQVEERRTRERIASGDLNRLSVEVAWKGERIAAFVGLALVSRSQSPVDKNSRIY